MVKMVNLCVVFFYHNLKRVLFLQSQIFWSKDEELQQNQMTLKMFTKSSGQCTMQSEYCIAKSKHSK